MTIPFGDRLAATLAEHGPLCVGIDPHAWLLREWGLPDDAAGAHEFGLRIVEAATGRAGIVKPQVAFFERHGSRGYAALEEVLAAARTAGLLVIADVKRGDVGSSVEAYGQAWLTPGSPLEADALTMSAYQGASSIAAPIALARATGKGVFVLAATSNPEAAATQGALIGSGAHGGMTVAAGIVADVIQLNAAAASDRLGSAGVVIGATVRMADFAIDPELLARHPATPILAPGFGQQGAQLGRLGELFGPAAPSVIASASRSILAAGPGEIAAAIAAHAAELTGAGGSE